MCLCLPGLLHWLASFAAQPFMVLFSAKANHERLVYELLVQCKSTLLAWKWQWSQSLCYSWDQRGEGRLKIDFTCAMNAKVAWSLERASKGCKYHENALFYSWSHSLCSWSQPGNFFTWKNFHSFCLLKFLWEICTIWKFSTNKLCRSSKQQLKTLSCWLPLLTHNSSLT